MTLHNVPWAINGAPVESSDARAASYGESGGAEGIIAPGGLKVSQLDVPGVGFKVVAGGALVLNRYQTNPTETYTVTNDAPVVCGSSFIPPASDSATSHLVCVTVGDPEFSQSGHPWMTADAPADGEEATFNYVRFYVIPNVAPGTVGFDQLNKTYPGYALARVDLPANAVNWQDSYIKDLRRVARPRSVEYVFNGLATSNKWIGSGVAVGAWGAWPGQSDFAVYIPPWATKANVIGFVEGAAKFGACQASVRANLINSGSTPVTNIDEAGPGGSSDRVSYNIGGAITIPAAQRGTNATLRVEAGVVNSASQNKITANTGTSTVLRIRFEETAV